MNSRSKFVSKLFQSAIAGWCSSVETKRKRVSRGREGSEPEERVREKKSRMQVEEGEVDVSPVS